MIGSQKRGKVLVTLVERKSRFLVARLATSKTAEAVTKSILDGLQEHASRVKSITFDNGKEFANHEQVKQQLECDVYFAHLYHSWERGTNENTNGLIRQYFPKGQSLDDVTEEELKAVVDKINAHPRMVLDFRTAGEVFRPREPCLNKSADG